MKILFTLFFLFCFVSFIPAQPTLTFENVGVQVGDEFPLHSFLQDIDEGSSGSNITWDFSNLGLGTVSTYTAVDPGSTPNGASFPTANVANFSQIYSYALSNVYGYSSCGVHNGFSAIYYDDHEDILRYPMTFGDAYTDSFHSNYVSGIPIERSGNIEVEADGYGTLILPWGSIDNVLRVHGIETYGDVSASLSFSYVSHTYWWYVPGVHYPLLYTSALSIDGAAPYYSTAYTGADAINIGHKTIQPELSIFPNPSSHQINIGNIGVGDEITITDLSGRTVYQSFVTNNYALLDVSQWNAGVYLLNVSSSSAVRTRKLFVE